MNKLLAEAIAAHGGLEQWNSARTLTATIVTGGELWGLKGLVQDAAPREMTVSLHEQRASATPFGQPDWRTDYTPGRIAIETNAGVVVKERLAPRDAFAGHAMDTPWDPLHRAYFNGYALWNYLAAPFLLAMPGVEIDEVEPWREGDETWRVLRVHFPDHIATHSREQHFYFGADHLLRRHDYQVDVAGGFAAAQYVDEIRAFAGLQFPTRRRAYLRDAQGRAVPERLLVAIDLGNIRLA